MRIGVIGLGVVGQALFETMKMFHEDVKGFDIDPSKALNSFEEVLQTDVAFLALPTPPNGSTNAELLRLTRKA